MTRRTMSFAAFVAMLGVIVGANWALKTFGVVTVLGVAMPAGVFFAGAAFGIRDVLHETSGSRLVLIAIATGTALSALLSDTANIPGGYTSIAIASGAAFAFSELLDLAVYTPMRQRNWPAAVAISNFVGSVVDSLLFLFLAFGSIAYAGGQIAGKFAMVALALPAVWMVRRALSVHNVRPTSAIRNDEIGVIGGDDDA